MTKAMSNLLDALHHVVITLSDTTKRKWILDGSGIQEAEVLVAVDHIVKALCLLGDRHE